ncbi:MAG: fused MFS/spermidine synthase [Acidobacteria bacterium]|nr:fused MFS/spermidine synthase [Acidobacteriota bacterium]
MRTVTAVFTVALFAGSVLLFLLEPLFGRLVLPTLGGAPAVWATCLVFFQLTLLAGYLYAWASTRWLGLRSQLAVHSALLVLAVAVLPVRIVPGWAPPPSANPIPWLLAVLTVSIGLPFFVVSTTAPILQHWFANTEHPDAHDPYFLYRASNLGSMIGLVGYPFLVEPWLGVNAQGIAWSTGYMVFAVLVLGCAALLWKHPRGQRAGSVSITAPDPAVPKTGPNADVAKGFSPAKTGLKACSTGSKPNASPDLALSGSQLLRWTTLAAVPSSLLLGVTTYLSTDVAVVPLLWVVPLLLYLSTFVLAFAPRPLIPTRVLVILLPLVVLPLGIVLAVGVSEPAWAFVPLHLAAFFISALICHQQLADERPPAQFLTLFYLCLSVGGAIGGLFNALVAPLVFTLPREYPLAIVAVCLLKPYRGVPVKRARMDAADLWMPVALGTATFALLAMTGQSGSSLGKLGLPLGLGLPVFLCYVFSPRPVRLGLGLAAVLLVWSLQPSKFGAVVDVERSFFGVHRVVVDSEHHLRLLFHGNTLHGAQSLDPAKAREPQTYYTRSGPAGQVFEAMARKAGQSIGVVGLGTGALAGYALPGQTWTFYEIDPVVLRLARDAGYFSFLRDAAVPVRVEVGDARLSLVHAPAHGFDLLVLDAFSSDAVPVHLLTREAVQLYLSKLKPGGVLAFHASSRFLRLRREFLALANDAGLAHVRQLDMRSMSKDDWSGWTPSEWVVMARDREDLGPLGSDSRWGRIEEPAARVWTDDYSNLLALFRWR